MFHLRRKDQILLWRCLWAQDLPVSTSDSWLSIVVVYLCRVGFPTEVEGEGEARGRGSRSKVGLGIEALVRLDLSGEAGLPREGFLVLA